MKNTQLNETIGMPLGTAETNTLTPEATYSETAVKKSLGATAFFPASRFDTAARIQKTPIATKLVSLKDKIASVILRRSLRLHTKLIWRNRETRLASIKELSIPGKANNIAIRIYTPEGEGVFPVLTFFHGGGFVLGDLDTHDPLCRDLSFVCNAIVVAVDYRRAPEHKFPAPSDDCLRATQWVFDNIDKFSGDPSSISVIGDSAGGNLAASVALQMKNDRKRALKNQILIYPVTDYHTPPTRSYIEKAKGGPLTRSRMIWFWKQYIHQASDALHPYASPLQMEELSNLPETLMMTAEHDPLLDEGTHYALELIKAGSPATQLNYLGQKHGFIGLSKPTRAYHEAIKDIAEWIETRV